MTADTTPAASPSPSKGRILFASLIGTTIEFFDFYIYATAAVLVFPALFFPPGDATTATLQSLATFALAFIARPIGAVIFGHFGDRVGRKATLVAALMTMGLSTIAIGLLPTYHSVGIIAPLLLALCRFGDHTYREAADALGVTPPTAAWLLTATVRSLAVAGPADGLADSA